MPSLLVRPSLFPSWSDLSSFSSPLHLQCVILDHGLYFDIDQELRSNYARFWLSLLSRSTPAVQADRRRYAKLIADIDDSLYPILESAITGRSGLEGSDPLNEKGVKGRERPGSLLDLETSTGGELSQDEQEHIRKVSRRGRTDRLSIV